MCGEIWREIPGWPGYKLSNKGNVSAIRKSFKGGSVNCSGQLMVTLCGGGKRRTVSIATLLREVFNTEPDLPGEQWRAVPGWPSYWISSFGRLRGRSNHLYSQPSDAKGYKRVVLYWNGAKRTWGVHQLVASAFIGSCPEGKEVNHKDGNPANNHIENLEYVTRSENAKHSYRELNRMPCFPTVVKDGHGQRKTVNLAAIENALADKVPYKTIAKQFKVSIACLIRIRNGTHWQQKEKHLCPML